MVILLAALSFFSFVLIELPPGNFVDNLIQQLRNLGVQVDLEEIRSAGGTLRAQPAVSRPVRPVDEQPGCAATWATRWPTTSR